MNRLEKAVLAIVLILMVVDLLYVNYAIVSLEKRIGNVESNQKFTIVLRSDPTRGCITFAHTGPACLYNGTVEVQWIAGEYELAAFSNIGYLFVSWNATGGILILNPTSNTTTIAVSGSGTIQANFNAMPSS
jgi:hypothetical protein